jgi:hypothetical protein
VHAALIIYRPPPTIPVDTLDIAFIEMHADGHVDQPGTGVDGDPALWNGIRAMLCQPKMLIMEV